MAFSDLRREYMQRGLEEAELAEDPFRQFQLWFDAAVAADVPEPNAMTLATATKDGRPSARMVLLKQMDDRGFVFFSNYESRKGNELAENPRAALIFFWVQLERQIRIEGAVEHVSAEVSADYFHSRPRGSQTRLGGLLPEPGDLLVARSWSDAPPSLRPSIPTARFHCQISGVASAWFPNPSSSGRAVSTACTTACAIARTSMATGSLSASRRSAYLLSGTPFHVKRTA